MNGEQKKLLFRSSAAVANQLFFSITVFETGTNRFTVAKITPEGYYAQNIAQNKTDWSMLYLPFKVGLQYTKQNFIDHASTYNYTLLETSGENAAPIVHILDIGTTSTPTAGTITATGATISWTNTNASENTKINVYISSNGGTTYTLAATKANNATSHALTGLTTATQYKVKVAPANDYGESDGLTVTFTTA